MFVTRKHYCVTNVALLLLKNMMSYKAISVTIYYISNKSLNQTLKLAYHE